MSASEQAFRELSHVFSTRGNQVLEIEIIPPSLGSSFLQDEASIGLTKKALVQAYTVARELFFKHLVLVFEEGTRAQQSHDELGDELGITEIMLLFDCEHLTACNWRKRQLLAAAARCAKAPDQIVPTKEMLKAELTLLTSFQTSPLHRHTKSPTLWSHRLWTVKQLLALESLSTNAMLKLQYEELAYVLRAGELHPRNYYAFGYMRQLHSFLASIATVEGRPGWSLDLAKSLLDPVLNWCYAHPRDISGWTFGKYLLHQISDQQIRNQVIARALSFARDIGWEGESFWTFVDQTVREFSLEQVVHAIVPLETEPSLSTGNAPAWANRLATAKVYWAAHKSPS
ncbi:hypothetical protein N7468_003248 [Penicillium chermesinum]|uniref:Uncharacterized protein n=1 Tax=Penicillium chermesinum TaxID=63820 RepID=A0A9W9TT69_9EURO|nr:uncharacterized protein N7468_003248 [Penicillium chermesinum]KAJ5238629.1 hypothetical protein N7468_003248 [Penicillium chermesinum]KAJ6164277.1 hypothetical protein N7470_002949 [Penicillium chermesinum]